jgi:hypothetical protein
MDFVPIIGGLTALIVFIGLSTPIIVIGLIYYYKKRLEHKQIMAAIEKGMPLSELRPPKPVGPLWIKYLTTGIALLIIGLGFGLLLGFGPLIESDSYVGTPDGTMLFIAFVLVAIGAAWFVRGLLYRKYQPQIQPPNRNNPAER